MKYFCLIKEKIVYMECVIQSSIFYSRYLSFSIVLCNVDSALVSDWNAYIWYCLYFKLYSNLRIYIRMLQECVFSTCSWKMASLDDADKKISQLHQELVNAYKKRFTCENGIVAVVKRFPLWEKSQIWVSSSFSNRSTETGG